MSVVVQEPSDEIVGKVLDGRFEVKSVLGEGGLGFVYLVRDRELGRDVALKILVPRYRGRPERESRLLAEAVKAKAVEHPRVVTSLGSGRLRDLGGCPFALFELVSGSSLNVRLAYDGAFEPLRAAEMLRELAGLVHACHEVRLVHRDVSVQNIFLEDDGALTLIDFSHAARLDEARSRATLHGEIPGAPWYMSPEQARGEQAAVSMDVFALGVVGFELLIGRNPYQTVQMDIFAELQGREELRQPKIDCRIFPDVPELLAEVINRCFALRASERISLDSLMSQLDDVISLMRTGTTGVSASPSGAPSSVALVREPSVVAAGARPAGDETMAQLARRQQPVSSATRSQAESDEAVLDEFVVADKAPMRATLDVGAEPETSLAAEPETSARPVRGVVAMVVAGVFTVFAISMLATKPESRTLAPMMVGSTQPVLVAELVKHDVGHEAAATEPEPEPEPDATIVEPATDADPSGPSRRTPRVRPSKPGRTKNPPSPVAVLDEAETERCQTMRAVAQSSHDRGASRDVLRKTRDRACWKGYAEARHYLRASAYFDQRDYKACAQAAERGTSNDVRALGRVCILEAKEPS